MTDAGTSRGAVSDFAGRIAALHGQTERARAALTDTIASAASPDGAVRVSVDTAGVLTGIEFGPAARDLDLPGLADAVLRTVHDARVSVLREAQRTVADAVGESSAAVAVLGREIAGLTDAPSAPPTHPTRPTPPVSATAPVNPTPVRRPADDEDEGGFTGRGQ